MAVRLRRVLHEGNNQGRLKAGNLWNNIMAKKVYFVNIMLICTIFKIVRRIGCEKNGDLEEIVMQEARGWQC